MNPALCAPNEHRRRGTDCRTTAGGNYALVIRLRLHCLLHESTQQALKFARRGDPHLRSTRALRGYAVQACDGVVGRVADFVIDDMNWTIRYVAIAYRNRWPGRTVVLPTCWVSAIDWSQSTMIVSAPRVVIQAGPAYRPSALADPVYETWLRVAYAQMQAQEHMIGA